MYLAGGTVLGVFLAQQGGHVGQDISRSVLGPKYARGLYIGNAPVKVFAMSCSPYLDSRFLYGTPLESFARFQVANSR